MIDTVAQHVRITFQKSACLHERRDRLLGQLPCPRQRRLLGTALRHDLADEPKRPCILCPKRVAQAEEAEGARIAELLGGQNAGRRVRHEAEIDEGHAEGAFVRCDHHVAMEQDGAADTDGVAVDTGQHRLRERRQHAEHVGDGGDELLVLGGKGLGADLA